jgi:hypothetical protein
MRHDCGESTHDRPGYPHKLNKHHRSEDRLRCPPVSSTHHQRPLQLPRRSDTQRRPRRSGTLKLKPANTKQVAPHVGEPAPPSMKSSGEGMRETCAEEVLHLDRPLQVIVRRSSEDTRRT